MTVKQNSADQRRIESGRLTDGKHRLVFHCFGCYHKCSISMHVPGTRQLRERFKPQQRCLVNRADNDKVEWVSSGDPRNRRRKD